MMLTNTEWLRFVTFGIVAGGTLGASYTAALVAAGRTLPTAMGGAVISTGVIAVLVHLTLRQLLNREVNHTDDTEETTA